MSNELMLPPYLFPSNIELEKVDSVGLFQPMFGFATSQRIDYGATHWRAKISFEKLTTDERHALLAFLTRAGRSRAFYVPIFGESERGAGSFAELLANNTFANGTASFAYGAELTVAVNNRQLRISRNAVSAVNTMINPNVVTNAQYAPHIGRYMLVAGHYPVAIYVDQRGSGGTQISQGVSTTGFGLVIYSFITAETTGASALRDETFSGLMAGDFVDVPWCSYSRCGLIDNGPNLLLRSDDLSNASWTKTNCTIAATSVVIPTGANGTTHTVKEDASVATIHLIEQGVTVAAAAADYCFAAAVKAVNRTWARIMLVETTGSTSYAQFINLSTGALGATSTGANWTNGRNFVRSLGNGWYYIAIVARKTNAATTVRGRVEIGEADNDTTFTGLTQDSILVWRATLAASGVPMQLALTVATADSDGALQTGYSINTKGWLVSTDNLLAAGDFVNVVMPSGMHLARLTAALCSDAAGLANMQFEPPLPESPVDNVAVIPNFPLLKCVLADVPSVKTYPPGYISDVDILVEGVFG